MTVPDLDAALAWYTKVLGLREIAPPWSIDRSLNPESILFKVYGDDVMRVKIGFLASANGCGLEMFEFEDPKMSPSAAAGFSYTRGGVFHICLTDPDPDAVKARVIENGGKAIGQTVVPYEDEPDSACYVQDPWGNVIEVLSCSMEQLFANRKQ
jgi:catechol 2,3-dioxygenase-like lactoylglutathione lyase family enzyme